MTEVDEKTVLNSEAYLLFYERILEIYCSPIKQTIYIVNSPIRADIIKKKEKSYQLLHKLYFK